MSVTLFLSYTCPTQMVTSSYGRKIIFHHLVYLSSRIKEYPAFRGCNAWGLLDQNKEYLHENRMGFVNKDR